VVKNRQSSKAERLAAQCQRRGNDERSEPRRATQTINLSGEDRIESTNTQKEVFDVQSRNVIENKHEEDIHFD
jgi:hypothetical protein